MRNFLKERVSLARAAGELSVFTLIAYHWPFFSHVVENIKADFNGVLITVGLIFIMLGLNYFFYYLVLFLGRVVGKGILGSLFYKYLSGTCH